MHRSFPYERRNASLVSEKHISMETEFWRERALLVLPIIPYGATCPFVTYLRLRENALGEKIVFCFVSEMQLREA